MELPSPESSLTPSFAYEARSAVVHELSFTIENSVASELFDSLSKSGMLMLGEMHGVRENTDIIYSLMKRLSIHRLALEWDETMENVAEQFLRDSTVDSDRVEGRTDGRVTAGHFGLLKRLEHDGLLDELICFDRPVPGGSWQDRDRSMADTLSSHLSNQPILMVAGNLHTRLEATEINNQTFHPAGEILKEQLPGLSSIKIHYGSGTFFNLEPKSFDDDPSIDSLALMRDSDARYSFHLPSAHAAIVPNNL